MPNRAKNRCECFKDLVPHTRLKKSVAYGTLIFSDFISLASQIMKEKFIAKTLGQIYPSNNRFKLLYQITFPGTWTLQIF